MYRGNIQEFIENLNIYLIQKFPEKIKLLKIIQEEILELDDEGNEIVGTEHIEYWLLLKTVKYGTYDFEITDDEDFEEQVYTCIKPYLK